MGSEGQADAASDVAVELGDHLSVSVAGGSQLVGAFFELCGQVDDGLFEVGDAAFEGVDVLGCAEP